MRSVSRKTESGQAMKPRLAVEDIGQPTNFRHVAHIGPVQRYNIMWVGKVVGDILLKKYD